MWVGGVLCEGGGVRRWVCGGGGCGDGGRGSVR